MGREKILNFNVSRITKKFNNHSCRKKQFWDKGLSVLCHCLYSSLLIRLGFFDLRKIPDVKLTFAILILLSVSVPPKKKKKMEPLWDCFVVRLSLKTGFLRNG